MKFMLAAVAAAVTLSGNAAAASADAHFKSIYTREWQWRLAQHIEDNDDDSEGISPDLPHVDAKTQAERLAYWQKVMKQLDGIRPADLSAPERVNFAVYRAQIAALAEAQRFRQYEQPVAADNAFWNSFTDDARRTFSTVADYRNYIKRMKAMPVFFSEEVANMRAGLARGFTPPKVALAGRDVPLASIADAKTPEETVFYLPFKNMPATIPAAEQEALRREAMEVIGESVQPAHASVLRFMRDEYLPHTRETLAAESLPDGKAYYQSKIVEFTTTTMTAAQIHQVGLNEMAKIRAEMQAAIAQSQFKGDFAAFLQFLRTDPRFYARTPEELLMRASYIAKKFDGKADQYFGYLPRRRFAIKPVPDDQAPFYTGASGGPGIYMLNTYMLPARPLYSLPALTLHESAPGHAFQMPIALEQKGAPPFRRAYISAYGEGWALYCERLGSEMGIYETPYETFGMLSYQAWRAARLVVDTGIHAQGWTRAQAQAYLHDNTALADHEIETEVDRYIAWPGQALSYYIGEMAIFEARRKSEAALGPRFDIRAFHDTVLQMGAVPLPVLAERIDAFIAGGGKGPYPDVK
ncbi:DUF885 domain-containing protein [Massilia phyllosphaerae]|uniref:DUF885 domain-containing protein n=1 Tax=Massilia phyllosphaerae TaxID=3106034 RepID=UPI002B1CBC3C|nr:DUF885 family protein [Massilia sp. SGZ-792]